MVEPRRGPDDPPTSSGPAPQPDPVTDAATPPRAGRSRLGLVGRILLLLFVGAGLWYGLNRVDWPALWRALLAADAGWIVAGVLSVLASHLLRAHRWRLLIPDGLRIPLRNAFSATIIGYMFNNIIPRSGELARPWLLARRENRPLSAMIASVVVERIIDGISLATIVVMLALGGRDIVERLLPEYTAEGLIAAIVVPVVALIVLLVLAIRTSLGDRLVELVAGRVPERLATRIRAALADFRSGVSVGGRGSGAIVLISSVVIWAGYALGMYFGFLAFDFDTTYGLGLQAMLVTLGITSIGMTIAPTPGGFLVYHSFCIAVLVAVYGVPNEEATAYALVTHGAPYIAVTAIGGIFALMENVSVGSMLRGGAPPEKSSDR